MLIVNGFYNRYKPGCNRKMNFDRELINRQLKKIIESRHFNKSKISCDLLEYLVSTSLEEKSPKEFTIGIELFGKKYGEETKPDANIRVYIHNLRKKLNDYYEEEGSKDPLVFEIEKGKYTVEKDPFMIASWIVWPSYISSWAALNYHKLTEQLPFTIHVATTRKRKKKMISFMHTKIKFIKIRKSAFQGFQKIRYLDQEIYMAEKEKALIDGLISQTLSLPEAGDIIKNNPQKISRRKLFAYARPYKRLAKLLKREIR